MHAPIILVHTVSATGTMKQPVPSTLAQGLVIDVQPGSPIKFFSGKDGVSTLTRIKNNACQWIRGHSRAKDSIAMHTAIAAMNHRPRIRDQGEDLNVEDIDYDFTRRRMGLPSLLVQETLHE